ncbi:nucleoside diphosphate kinase B-like isoform X2 [Hypanus sabinus]|uniref:nucleoside diphosphate kinase B-like isoform X2 n=1 Tax=Hypanus sabinus TaxID=79690 RepID=UPI0028C4855B|nr:nucleoside diphosphate kinase B-like isoform X2 [Hypanus sabinus]
MKKSMIIDRLVSLTMVLSLHSFPLPPAVAVAAPVSGQLLFKPVRAATRSQPVRSREGSRNMAANLERTFIAVKPDGVQRGIVGDIIKRFEQKGFKLVAMKFLQVWEGLNVVKTARVMLGETNPADSKPGTIRGDFCIQIGRNIIHGSDSVPSAQKEICLWFKPEELVNYKNCAHDWIYE